MVQLGRRSVEGLLRLWRGRQKAFEVIIVAIASDERDNAVLGAAVMIWAVLRI